MNFKLSNFADHPSSTVAGLLVGITIAASILQKFDWSHMTPGSICGIVGAIAAALLGAFFGRTPGNSGSNGSGPMTICLLFALMFCPMVVAQDQAVPSGSNGFAAATEAVAIHINGQWTVGTEVTQSFDFLDFGKLKTHHLYLQGNQLIAPEAGFNIYAGGLKYEPDLSKLVAKTNVPASNFSLFAQGSIGNGIPSSGGSHISYMAGGGVRYRLTGTLTWTTLQAQWLRFGSTNGASMSTGLHYNFWK
jgi:hypothetical protein